MELNERQFQLFDPGPRRDPKLYFHYSDAEQLDPDSPLPFHGGTVDAALDRASDKAKPRPVKGSMTAFRVPMDPDAETVTDGTANMLDSLQMTSPSEYETDVSDYRKERHREVLAQNPGGNVYYWNDFEDPGSTSVRLSGLREADVVGTLPYTFQHTDGTDNKYRYVSPGYRPYGHEGRPWTHTLSRSMSKRMRSDDEDFRQERLF